jgi:hypothetical protein
MISYTPTSIILQPANIGLLSLSNLGGMELFTKRPVHPLFTHNNMTYGATSAYVGAPLLFQDDDLTISLAAGYSRIVLDYGEMILLNGANTSHAQTFHPIETSDNLTIGAAFNYGVLLTTGFTFKKIKSEMPSFNVPGGALYYTARPTAVDFGVGVKVPLHSYVDMNGYLPPPISSTINFSLAYALNNFGQDVSYTDPLQADPLPRIGRLSWSADIGLTYNITPKNKIDLLQIAIARESEAALFKRRNDGSVYYLANPLGKTNIYKSMIAGTSYDGIASRKGHAISILGTVSIQRGSFQYFPLEFYKTKGITIRTDGIFAFVSQFESVRTGIIGLLLDHLGVQYSSGSFESENYWFGQSSFDSITLTLKR